MMVTVITGPTQNHFAGTRFANPWGSTKALNIPMKPLAIPFSSAITSSTWTRNRVSGIIPIAVRFWFGDEYEAFLDHDVDPWFRSQWVRATRRSRPIRSLHGSRAFEYERS